MAYETVGRPGSGATADPSGHASTPPHDPRALGHVARDMESIFGAQVLHQPPHLTAQTLETTAEATRSGPRVGTILGTLVVAISAGALYAFVLDGPSPGSSPQASALGAGTSVAPRILAGGPVSTTTELVPAQAPVVDGSPTAPVRAGPGSPTPGPSATQQPQARVAPRPTLADRARDPVRRAAPANDCAGGSGPEQAQCDREAMRAAENGLRRAYAQARRAGVPSAVLANYNERWSDLQHSPETPPLWVAAGYWALAAELDRHASDVESDPAEDLSDF